MALEAQSLERASLKFHGLSLRASREIHKIKSFAIINHWHLLRFCLAVANEVKQKPCSLQERPRTDANRVSRKSFFASQKTTQPLRACLIFRFVALTTASRSAERVAVPLLARVANKVKLSLSTIFSASRCYSDTARIFPFQDASLHYSNAVRVFPASRTLRVRSTLYL